MQTGRFASSRLGEKKLKPLANPAVGGTGFVNQTSKKAKLL